VALRDKIASVGGRVLEVACGPGIEYEGLKKAGVRVDYVGVDVTRSMVELCTRRFPEATFQVGNAESLPFADESFDVVFAKDLYEHLEDFRGALRDMYRVARKRVVVYFFLPLVDAPTKYEKHPESGFHHNHYSRQELVSYSTELGATSVSIEDVHDEQGRLGHLVCLAKRSTEADTAAITGRGRPATSESDPKRLLSEGP
jgi:ubiquinone/menaquinone biosynthesis C-methylase UbiE